MRSERYGAGEHGGRDHHGCAAPSDPPAGAAAFSAGGAAVATVLFLSLAALLPGRAAAQEAAPDPVAAEASGPAAPAAEAASAVQRPAVGTEAAAGKTAVVIHGGAGTIRREDMSEEREQAYRSKLREALMAGHGVLEDGGSALDAVMAAIRVMEESPLFNAGVGGVFTSEGTVEHDASIMDGRTLNSGAVTGVKRVPSPISLARLVMDSSRHVMLAQEGAETFAEQQGIELVPNETFHTERRRRAWERWKERQSAGTSGPAGRAVAGDGTPAGEGARHGDGPSERVMGTVGAAALDRDGNLAAGTSTGGTSNKRFGRIGDSPIIGAGTYADNETAAISATGHGELFIRMAVAHDIVSMMRYTGLPLVAAANAVVHGKLVDRFGAGTGGVIALDRQGNIATPFNTSGMYRGYVDTEGNVVVEIYRD